MLQFCFISKKKKKKKKGEDVTILRDTVTTSWSADDICFLILNISCWSDILVLYLFSSTLPVLACYRCDYENSIIVDLKTSGSFEVCSGILSDALSARPHQSKQLSFTALSSQTIFLI